MSNNQKTIAIVTQTFPPKMGGMEMVMEQLAENLGTSSYKVKVFASRPYENSSSYEFYYISGLKWLRNFRKKRLVSHHCDDTSIYICDSWKSVAAIPKSARKIIVLAHGQEYINKLKKHSKIKSALSRASKIVSSSQFTASLITELFPDFSKGITVVYPTYGVKTPTKRQTKQSSQTTQIITICRIDQRKGLRASMEALQQLKYEGLSFQWVIGGTGPDLDYLKQLAENLGLSSRVNFKGRITEQEKSEMLSSSDLFLMPSYQEGDSIEGFGISYIEASSYGLPCIGGKAGGAPEAVINGVTGWTVDGHSKADIREALQEAISNTDRRQKFGIAAYNRFKAELQSDKALEQLKYIIYST